jgi:hypothetical protein
VPRPSVSTCARAWITRLEKRRTRTQSDRSALEYPQCCVTRAYDVFTRRCIEFADHEAFGITDSRSHCIAKAACLLYIRHIVGSLRIYCVCHLAVGLHTSASNYVWHRKRISESAYHARACYVSVDARHLLIITTWLLYKYWTVETMFCRYHSQTIRVLEFDFPQLSNIRI